MVVAYVRLDAAQKPECVPIACVYALLLPSATNNEWEEIVVQQSPLAGSDVFPRHSGELDWSSMKSTPVVLPYLGIETVFKDGYLLKTLLEVLRGNFECCTLGELQERSSGAFVADGNFIVRSISASSAKPLPPETLLLQVGATAGGDSSAIYLLANEVRSTLHLMGEHAHLFDMLCGHEHERAEQHLATHLASLQRMEKDVETGIISEHYVHGP